jgi:hypothetical protein
MKLDPQVKTKWLEALRSGKYQQGVGYVVSIGDEVKVGKENQYCCIGVGAQALAPQTDPRDIREFGTHGAAQRLGLDTTTERILIAKNDLDEWSFRKIADWIEENL